MEYLWQLQRIRRVLHKPILHILLITAFGIIAYSNTFNVPFHLDDYDVIVENPIITDLNFFLEPSRAQTLKSHFEYETFKQRYIGYLTFALNYKIHGLDVAGYHILNVTLHILNALLVYWLILLTLRTPYFSRTQFSCPSGNPAFPFVVLLPALLFVSHPIQTQAVTYIWQRVTSLATMLYLLSIVFYIKWRISGNMTVSPFRLPLALSLITAVLAMKTKEISFTLPLVIALYEFMFFKGCMKKRVLYLMPFLLTMLIIPLTLIGTSMSVEDLFSDAGEATKVFTTISRLNYLFTEIRVIVTYMRLLVLPINQALIYDYPIYYSFFDPNVILSFLFIAAILGLAVYLLYRSRSAAQHLRLVPFGIFWFFLTLSVESSIIPIVDVINEHRVYLPSVGAVIAFSAAIFYISQLFASRYDRMGVFWPALCILLTTMVVTLFILTYARNTVWKDEVTLWEDTVKKSPNAAIPHNSLGIAYARQNRFDEAIPEYQKALRLKPDYAWAHNNLGAAYVFKGLLDMAITEYQAALHLKPDYAEARYNLAFAFIQKGNVDLARREVERALEIKPYYYEARQLLNYIISNAQHVN